LLRKGEILPQSKHSGDTLDVLTDNHSVALSQNNSISKRIYTKRTVDEIRRWTIDECQLYQNFIENYYDVMIEKNNKRNTKIFTLMS
jgi:hypothetical protein